MQLQKKKKERKKKGCVESGSFLLSWDFYQTTQREEE